MFCDDCEYFTRSKDSNPCCKCLNIGHGTVSQFAPITNHGTRPKQEEINHPSRYAGGKYECIDVMTDVFGVDAVKDFCKLNAFKYLWREKQKNGIEDLKKASWYLNKLIELSENSNENV